jgi:YD repeat-containing protein
MIRKRTTPYLFLIQVLLAFLFIITPPETSAVEVCEDNSSCYVCRDCPPSDVVTDCNGSITYVHTLHDYLCGGCIVPGFDCCYDIQIYCTATNELVQEYINKRGYSATVSCGACPPCSNDNDNDGYTDCDGDCDDNDPAVYPGVSEICDGKDNNCDGNIDECCPDIDSDSDGYTSCGGGDCNDSDSGIHPNVQEVCGDEIDNNCDGQIDETCGGDDMVCEDVPYRNTTDLGSVANLASGNFYHSQEILSSKSITFTISYNSLDTTKGPLGRGWTHTFNINISEYYGRLVLAESDGRRVYFNDNGDSTYSPEVSSGRYATITKNIDDSYTLTEKSGVTYGFDSTGKIASITDRNNNTISLTYTGNNLTKITDAYGRETVLVYDANDRIESITDPADRATTFAYDLDFLITVTDPLSGIWRYTYDIDGRMFSKTPPVGSATTYTYDANGKITSSKITAPGDPDGITKTISYDEINQTVTVTERNGSQWTYVYDGVLNRPLETTDVSTSQTTYFEYYPDGNISKKTEPNGRITDYVYVNGDMTSRIEALGTVDERTTTYTYNSYGQVLTITTHDGIVTKYTYDSVTGNMLSKTEAFGTVDEITTNYTYYSDGQVDTIIDPKGYVTKHMYDQYGNVENITYAYGVLNQTITYVNDIMGNVKSMSDANGNKTDYEYDSKDQLKKQINPDGGEINYEYDLRGNRTAVTDANGNRTTYTYDVFNTLVITTDPDGNTITNTYDDEGNVVSTEIKDSVGTVMTSTTYTYDIYNKFKKTIHQDTTYTELTYDDYGNIETKRDENGKITTFGYDFLDRLKSVKDPDLKDTLYTYDYRDNLKTVEDANNNITSYDYDKLNRLKLITSPDTGLTEYTYDDNGNMETKKDAENVTVTYIYDELNRLEEIQFPDPLQNISYTYDDPQSQNSIGRLSSMTDPLGTTWYDYDVMGRIIMETKQIDGLNYRTQYTYDLNGNLETITYPGGRIITYGYNQLNKVTSVTETMNGVTRTFVNNITYLPFGDVLSITLGNGIMTTKTYNNRYHMTDMDIGTVKDLTYTRDNTGNITGITDNLVPAKNKSYTYDNLYRLDIATGQWGTLDYGYDNVGNRTDEIKDTGSTIYNTTYNYTLNTNKLESTTGEKALTFSYDNNGNTKGENARQYNYNQNQRLAQAVEGTDVIGEYVYNGNGQRVKKYTENGTKCTIYHYDQNGHLIAESSFNR